MNQKPPHAHPYRAITTTERGHRHVVYGFTFSANGSNLDDHTHFYRGITTAESGHYHRYYGITGPPIALPNGTHYHEISGRVYRNYVEPIETPYGGVVYQAGKKEVHDHRYKGRTGEPLGYFPEDW